MQVQTVAAALEIHPFMLSKWRKDVKDDQRPSTELLSTLALRAFLYDPLA